MPFDLTQTLIELVSLPSVNPMGKAVDGPEYFEYRVTEYLESLFHSLELPFERQTVAPKRDNIIARLDGEVPVSAGGPLVLFEAHQDTVPVDGMTIEPWTPAVRDGRFYGRGACDIKGGMTAMLGALARLARERPPGMPTLVMACTVNEEHGYTGATALTQRWEQGGSILSAAARRGRRGRADRVAGRSGAQRSRPLAQPPRTAARATARSPSWPTTRSTEWRRCWRR